MTRGRRILKSIDHTLRRGEGDPAGAAPPLPLDLSVVDSDIRVGVKQLIVSSAAKVINWRGKAVSCPYYEMLKERQRYIIRAGSTINVNGRVA